MSTDCHTMLTLCHLQVDRLTGMVLAMSDVQVHVTRLHVLEARDS